MALLQKHHSNKMDSTFFLFLLYFTITTAATPDEDNLPLFDYDFGTTGMEHIGGVSNFPAIENVSFALFKTIGCPNKFGMYSKMFASEASIVYKKVCISLQKLLF